MTLTMTEAFNIILAQINASFLVNSPLLSRRQILPPLELPIDLWQRNNTCLEELDYPTPAKPVIFHQRPQAPTEYFPQRQTSEVQSPRSRFVQPRNADNAE